MVCGLNLVFGAVVENLRQQEKSRQNLKRMFPREPSYIVSGNVNLCSYYGKQYRDSLKN